MTINTLPDSQILSDEVSESVRMMEIQTYGKENLPCGPALKESEEFIIVEGRADVLNMLKHGFKNVISMNGSSVPSSIITLSKTKTAIVFVDGDRGGDLNIRELISVADIDFVCKAPDGKEVEEITKKEVHKALRGKITSEQARLDLGVTEDGELIDKNAKLVKPMIKKQQNNPKNRTNQQTNRNISQRRPIQNRTISQPIKKELSVIEKKKLKKTLDDLFGTRGACIFNQKLDILGKVPTTELKTTIKSLRDGIHALALDGPIDKELVSISESLGIKFLIGKESKGVSSTKLKILSGKQL